MYDANPESAKRLGDIYRVHFGSANLFLSPWNSARATANTVEKDLNNEYKANVDDQVNLLCDWFSEYPLSAVFWLSNFK